MSKRNVYIDYLKGLGILLVVVGHCWMTSGGIFWLIYRFHMILFFLISGYLFSTKKVFSKFVQDKIKSIMIPYVIFCIVSIVISKFLFNYNGSIGESLKIVIYGGNYLKDINNFALWFLPVLFFATICTYPIAKIKSKYTRLLIAVLLLVSVNFETSFLIYMLKTENIILKLNVVPAAMGLLLLGQLLKEANYLVKMSTAKLTRKHLVLTLLSLVVGLALAFGSWDQIISVTNVAYFISGILICHFVVTITINRKNKYLIRAGKNSIYILGIHRLLLEIIMRANLLPSNVTRIKILGDVFSILISVVIVAVICFLALGINKLISEIKTHWNLA